MVLRCGAADSSFSERSLTPEIHIAGTQDARILTGRFRWCGREDSNFHGLPHSDLNAARLPIPPRPHVTKEPVLAGPAHVANRFGAHKYANQGNVHKNEDATRTPCKTGPFARHGPYVRTRKMPEQARSMIE